VNDPVADRQSRQVLTNTAANVVARLWAVLSNFIFVPAYLALLGMEQFSLITFSLLVMSFLAMMDAGLTATLSRQFASPDPASAKLRVLATLETCYFAIAGVVLVGFALLAHPLATSWLNVPSIPSQDVSVSLQLIGVASAFQLLGNFYVGGLVGMERQVTANAYQVAWSLARNGGVLVVVYFWRSIEVFFAWQALTTIAYAILARQRVLADLGAARSLPRFRIEPEVLRSVWRFAAGMTAIAVVASINAQADRLVMSKLLSIVELGYYTLGVSLGQALVTIVSSIGVAVLPRLTNLYASNEPERAAALYQQTLLATAIVVFVLGGIVAVNGREVLWVWTGDVELAARVATYVPYSMIGSALLALQIIPFSVAIAHGYTRINRWLALSSVVLTIPAYIVLIQRHGGLGAAWVWFGLNLVATPILFVLVHRKFLRGSVPARGYLQTLAAPLAVAAAVAALAATLRFQLESRVVEFVRLSLLSTTGLAVAGLMLIRPAVFSQLLTVVRRRFQA
jgi:O-antigen/teichoic acid export membrane protein